MSVVGATTMQVRNVTRGESYEFDSYAEMLRMYAVFTSQGGRTGWQRFWRVAPFLIRFVREARRWAASSHAA